VTGRYDEWEAARAPSLRRFAHALVDCPESPVGPGAADDAVHRALSKVESKWDRVATREDPDLVARALVVRAVPGRRQAVRRRAAAVLRSMEDRSDAEIAEILGCSESAARTHVGRGLVAAPEPPRPMADVGAVQVLTRPRPVAVEPRRTRRGGAWWGAAAVVALVGGIAVVDQLTSTPAGVITYPTVRAPSDWRTESFAGVQVQVPATWGWGGAPFRSDIFGAARLGGCGSDQAAVRSPSDPASYVSSATPFVGRPAQLSFRCAPWGSDGVMPQADAVWLGSPLPVGLRNVHGVVAETRAVGGQRVTVFSDRSSLRRQVLGTAEVVDVDDNGCPTQPVLRPTRGDAVGATSVSVCVYSQDSGTAALEWSGQLDGSAARSYDQAVQAAAVAGSECPAPSGQWVALGVRGSGGDVRWDLALPGCGAIDTARGRAPMTEDTVRDWATGGVTAYVAGPADRSLAEWFRADVGGATY
jgi:hypothetical protein